MPQRFPHDDGADLGDNYISGLYSQTPDEMGGLLTHPAYADRYMKAHYLTSPRTVREHTPDIIKPFSGAHDRSLKLNDWTDRTQDKLRKRMRKPLADPLFRDGFRDRRLPTRAYLRQWHPKARNRHAHRQDRFPPLSRFPNHMYINPKTREKAPLGAPTPEENALVNGELNDKIDPFAIDKVLGDTEKPAEEVLKDADHNNFLQKQQGEPITDSLLGNWDLQNGVADP